MVLHIIPRIRDARSTCSESGIVRDCEVHVGDGGIKSGIVEHLVEQE